MTGTSFTEADRAELQASLDALEDVLKAHYPEKEGEDEPKAGKKPVNSPPTLPEEKSGCNPLFWLRNRNALSSSTDAASPQTPSPKPAAAGTGVVAKAQPPNAASIKFPARFNTLAQAFDLNPEDKRVLFVAAAPELRREIARLCARAHPDDKCAATFDLVNVVYGGPPFQCISPEGRLRAQGLLTVEGDGPLEYRSLKVCDRIAEHLQGWEYLAGNLPAIVWPVGESQKDASLAVSQEKVVDQIGNRWGKAARSAPPVFHLLGASFEHKEVIAARATANQTGNKSLYRLTLEAMPAAVAQVDKLLALWNRESLLTNSVLLIDAQDWDEVPRERQVALERFTAGVRSPLFVATREPIHLPRQAHRFDIHPPLAREQRKAWASFLSLPEDRAPARLSAQFDFNLFTIKRLAVESHRRVEESGKQLSLEKAAWEASREQGRPRLESLSQRIDVKADKTRLILPKEELAILDQIVATVDHRDWVYHEVGFNRVSSRGFGVSVLFAGPSGTGKTTAAEVLAQRLHLDLYRIDLASVISKYVGETEKNLRRLFDTAEEGGVILLFDECDSIFHARVPMREGHDRYANIQVNDLLTRLESFRGLTILATNRKEAIDQAFLRRLRFVIDFPFPDQDQRRLIWENVFPKPHWISDPAAPSVRRQWLDTLDSERLAQFDLSGGNIYNIALQATSLAAANGRVVTMKHVLAAARAEFRKLNRPVIESDFEVVDPSGTSINANRT